jgi:hypothetical protein
MEVVGSKKRESAHVVQELLGKWDKLMGTHYCQCLHIAQLRVIVLDFHGAHGIEMCAQWYMAQSRLVELHEFNLGATLTATILEQRAAVLVHSAAEAKMDDTMGQFSEIIKSRAEIGRKIEQAENEMVQHRKVVDLATSWLLARIRDEIGPRLDALVDLVVGLIRNGRTMHHTHLESLPSEYTLTAGERRSLLPELEKEHRVDLISKYIRVRAQNIRFASGVLATFATLCI